MSALRQSRVLGGGGLLESVERNIHGGIASSRHERLVVDGGRAAEALAVRRPRRLWAACDDAILPLASSGERVRALVRRLGVASGAWIRKPLTRGQSVEERMLQCFFEADPRRWLVFKHPLDELEELFVLLVV